MHVGYLLVFSPHKGGGYYRLNRTGAVIDEDSQELENARTEK